jgi:diguanylate cyclase
MELHKNNPQDLEYWKQKYLDNLDDYELKEKEWHELEELLHHCIARLAVAGYGVNSRLDRKLDELRNAVRRTCDTRQLDDLIRDITDTAASLKDPQQSPYEYPIGVLAKLLDGIKFPPVLRKSVKRLKKQLASAEDGGSLKPLVQDFIELLQQGLEIGIEGRPPSPDGRRDASQTGRLARFLGAISPTIKTTADSKGEPSSNQDSIPTEARVLNRILDRSELPGESQMQVQALRQRIDGERSSTALVQLADEVAGLLSKWMQQRDFAQAVRTASSDCPLNQFLLELLLRFDMPERMQSRVEALRALLHDDKNPKTLPSILESFVALVTDMRRNVQGERQEIEQFLKIVTDRLLQLDANLQSAEQSRRESMEDGRDLGSSVRDQVTHLRTSMAEASDLEQLKQAVKTGLDAVQEHMKTYVLAEERRGLETEKRVQELGAQLRDVSARAGNLQEQIKRQQSRALSDSLTGLYNRMAYDERIQQDFVHWKRYKDPLSLLVIDVDRFKALNDRFGHQTGDKALKVLAQQMQSKVREADFAARYGGEEFVIILPRTERDDALRVAEKLRSKVEECKFHYRGQPVPITICCGIAEFRDGDTPESVFQRGDEAMYQAKRDGRNRCCLEK